MLSLVSEYECRCPRDALFGLKKVVRTVSRGPVWSRIAKHSHVMTLRGRANKQCDITHLPYKN